MLTFSVDIIEAGLFASRGQVFVQDKKCFTTNLYVAKMEATQAALLHLEFGIIDAVSLNNIYVPVCLDGSIVVAAMNEPSFNRKRNPSIFYTDKDHLSFQLDAGNLIFSIGTAMLNTDVFLSDCEPQDIKSCITFHDETAYFKYYAPSLEEFYVLLSEHVRDIDGYENVHSVPYEVDELKFHCTIYRKKENETVSEN